MMRHGVWHIMALWRWLLGLWLTMFLLSGCRGDDIIMPAENVSVGDIRPESAIKGFYLLNEGNMGSNKCSLDFYDYSTGIFTRNFYAERNPQVVKELGDVGNDLQIYKGRMYAVINCSHKVEVMDAFTGLRIGQIDIPNCRYIRFKDGRGYVSSYVGPVQIGQDSPRGMVYEFDVETLEVTRKVSVGYQPEEMVIVDDVLYVANSGGYRAPDYDFRVSVIDLVDFKQIRQIPVAINLHRIRVDGYGRLWVTSRGNHGDVPSRLFILERDELTKQYEVTGQFDVSCSNLAIQGDILYYIASEWDDAEQRNVVSYGSIDLATCQLASSGFIKDGTQDRIMVPYGLAIHPESGDIFLTDARNYVSSGVLYCFDSSGRKKWSVNTGDIPACIAFLNNDGGEEAHIY